MLQSLCEKEATEIKQQPVVWGGAQGYPSGVPGQDGFQAPPGNIQRQPGQEGLPQGQQGLPRGQQIPPGYPGQFPPYPYPGNPWYQQGFMGGQIAGQGENQPGSPQGVPQPGQVKDNVTYPQQQYMPPGFNPYQGWGQYGQFYQQPPPPYNSGKEPSVDDGSKEKKREKVGKGTTLLSCYVKESVRFSYYILV